MQQPSSDSGPMPPPRYKKKVKMRGIKNLNLESISHEDPDGENGVSHQNGSSSPDQKPAHKRIRMLSDSEPDSSPVKANGSQATDTERKVSFLQNAYPNMDPTVIRDTLKYVTENDIESKQYYCSELTTGW